MTAQACFRKLPRSLRRHRLVQLALATRLIAARQEIRFNGNARLIGDLTDPNVRNYFLTEEFEPDFFAIARPFVARGGVFFDIGANFGFCSFGLLGTVAPGALECHLFEANRRLGDLLSASAKLHPGSKARVNVACVTDQAGTSRLTLTPEMLGGSFVDPAGGGEEVANIVLDEYLARHGIGRVDFMKMDIEGHEWRALLGARRALATGVLAAIYLEIAPRLLRRQGGSAGQCLALLRENGYRIFFCKEGDLANCRDVRRELSVNGAKVPVAEVRDESFAEDFQSDLLAVHASSPALQDGGAARAAS